MPARIHAQILFALGSEKGLKQMLEVLLADADSTVGNTDLGEGLFIDDLFRIDQNLDQGVLRRKFESVGDQIDYNLLRTQNVYPQELLTPEFCNFEFYVFGLRLRLHD